MYKALLFDLDDTILSFSKAEEYALIELFKEYKIDINKDYIELYKKINLQYWHRLEKKEIKREDILNNRFKEFFNTINYQYQGIDLNKANDIYFHYLTSKVFYIDGAISALKILKTKYKIYLITNGLKNVQEKRLKIAYEINNIFDYIFISEEINCVKPNKEFIDKIVEITNLKKEEMLIIGDSLSSDMALGINSGVDTCWFNEKEEKTVLKIKYIVKDYDEILKILM